MRKFSFRGPDRDLDHHAKYRDRALAQLGPRASDSIAPGLSTKVQAAATQPDRSLYDQLLTGDGTTLASSQDDFMTKEVGTQFALDVAAASKAVELSSLNPLSFLDQRHIARISGNLLNSDSRVKVTSQHTNNIYDSFLNLTNFEDLVQAASGGLEVYYSITVESRNIMQDASKMAASHQTTRKSEDKKVWDDFLKYARKRNFDPLETSNQHILDWLTYRARTTGSGPKVEQEFQCLRRWRYNAGKPLGPLPSEGAIAQGLLGYLDPVLGNVKAFLPFQLQELLKVTVKMEAHNKFGALRQMSLYVLQFWGVARFVDVQKLKIGDLLRGRDYYHLALVKHGLGTSKNKEVMQIFPTDPKFHSIFCPVAILSNYCKIRSQLAPAEETSFLFPRLSLSFESEVTPTRLRLATPEEALPTNSFKRKFKNHVDSAELQKLGVNSLEFTPDSLTLGGKNCLVNGAVIPDFDPNNLTPAANSSVGSLKRPRSAMSSVVLPEFGIPIKRKAPASYSVGNSAPEARTSASNSQQVRRPTQPPGPPMFRRPPPGPPLVSSQASPEETPATVLPHKIRNLQNLGLKTSVRDKLSRFPHITVTKAVQPTQSQSIDPPLEGLAKMSDICNKYNHLWD